MNNALITRQVALAAMSRRAAIQRAARARNRMFWRAAVRKFGRIDVAAGTIQNAYRNYRSAKRLIGAAARARRAGIGKRRGEANTKRTEIENQFESLASRTLYTEDVTNIPQSTANQIDGRQRQLCYVVGFKFCFEWRSNAKKPVFFNIALVHDKRTSSTDTSISDLNDFFRAYTTNRAQSFSNVLTSNEFRCLPLNSDRFTILKHHRRTIQPEAGNTDYEPRNGNNHGTMDMWVPLKRQIRFDGDNAESKVWLIYWCDQAMNASGTLPVNDTLELFHKTVTYFRETRGA